MLKLYPDQAQKWIDMAVHAVRQEGGTFLNGYRFLLKEAVSVISV